MSSEIIYVGESDLLPARVAPTRDPIAGYVEAFLRVKGNKSAKTARAYRYALDSWVGYCGRYGLDPLNVRLAHGQLWDAEMRDSGLADGTRAGRISAVSSWYGWMAESDIEYRANPAAPGKWRPGAHPKKTPALSKEQMTRILNAADADGPRSAAVAWVLFNTGIRVGELLSADLESLGYVGGHQVLTVVAKGGARHTVTLTPPTAQRIEAYRSTRPDDRRLPARAAGARGPRPLIVTATGRRVDPRTIDRLLKKLGRRAKLPDEVVRDLSPHVARATYITLGLAGGKTLREVQLAVGHGTPNVTAGYDRSHLLPENSPAYTLMAIISETQAHLRAETATEETH